MKWDLVTDNINRDQLSIFHCARKYIKKVFFFSSMSLDLSFAANLTLKPEDGFPEVLIKSSISHQVAFSILIFIILCWVCTFEMTLFLLWSNIPILCHDLPFASGHFFPLKVWSLLKIPFNIFLEFALLWKLNSYTILSTYMYFYDWTMRVNLVRNDALFLFFWRTKIILILLLKKNFFGLLKFEAIYSALFKIRMYFYDWIIREHLVCNVALYLLSL